MRAVLRLFELLGVRWVRFGAFVALCVVAVGLVLAVQCGVVQQWTPYQDLSFRLEPGEQRMLPIGGVQGYHRLEGTVTVDGGGSAVFGVAAGGTCLKATIADPTHETWLYPPLVVRTSFIFEGLGLLECALYVANPAGQPEPVQGRVHYRLRPCPC